MIKRTKRLKPMHLSSGLPFRNLKNHLEIVAFQLNTIDNIMWQKDVVMQGNIISIYDKEISTQTYIKLHQGQSNSILFYHAPALPTVCIATIWTKHV